MNILTPRTQILLTILNSVASGNLFAIASRSTAWSNEASPPDPADVTPEEALDDVLFTKRIPNSQVCVMIPRVEWAAGAVTEGDIVITLENHVYASETTGTSVSAPTWVSGTQTESGGTVSWRFLYTLRPEAELTFGDIDSIPVPWSAEEIYWSSKAEKIRIVFDFVGSENGFFPLETTYRIAGLYANPFERKPRNNVSGKGDFSDYGVLLGIDTFTPVVRTSEQVERYTFDIVLPT